MKKILLVIVAVVANITVQAQVFKQAAKWSKTLTPVTEAKKLGGTRTAVAADGSVFTTGTYNNDLTFGSSYLDPDGLTPAYLAKYSADGKELWAVGLVGNSLIHAITTDADGNVYLLGTLAEEVEFESVDGVSKTANGMKIEGAFTPTRRAAFVAKYDKDGNLKMVRTIDAATNYDVVSPDTYFDNLAEVQPTALAVSNGKVYVGLRHDGDVIIDNVNWKGRYNFAFGFMHVDNHSVGIMSMNADDLMGATSVADFGSKEMLTNDGTFNAMDVSFTVANGTVYAAFVGYGKLALTTAKGTQDFTTEIAEGTMPRVYVLASISESNVVTKAFTTKADKDGDNYRIGRMVLEGDKLFVSGVSAGSNPFNNDLPAVGARTLFVASLNAADLALNWVAGDAYDEGDVNHHAQGLFDMLVNNGEVLLAGYAEKTDDHSLTAQLNYWVTADGTVKPAASDSIVSVAKNKDVVAVITNAKNQTTVSVYDKKNVTGINQVVVSKADRVAVYNLNGQYVGTTLDGLSAGVYLLKKGNDVQKVLVK